METRPFVLLAILLSGTTGDLFAQGRWQQLISKMEQENLSLSFTVQAGTSYFDYDTKAINNYFPTAEASLEVQFSKKLNDFFRINAGLRMGRKFSKNPGYDYNSLEVTPEEYQYSLIEVDRVVSEYAHQTLAVPLVIQYMPGRVWLGVGGSYRHYSSPRNYTGYPSDFLAGKHDGGLIAH